MDKTFIRDFAELNSFEDIKLWSSASPYVASKPIYLHLLARVSNKYNTEFIKNNFQSSKYSRILFNIYNKYSDLIEKVPSYRLRRLLSPYHKRDIVGFTNIKKTVQNEIDRFNK